DERQIKLPAGLRVATISPAGFKVRFEPRLQRDVPVQPVLEGEPAPGYRLVRSVAAPKKVSVSGAKSVVESIARAPTLPLRIAEAKETLRETVALAPAPPHSAWTT